MATEAATSNAESSNPELDVQKLHSLPSEQQDLYILTFTSDLTRHVASLDADGATSHQFYVKKELFKVLSLSSPAPTRVIRNNVGQCFAGIFEKGDRKLLIESINELVAMVQSAKVENKIRTRHAAVHCIGALFEAAGDSAVMLSTATVQALFKLVKSASAASGYRAAIFRALGKIVKGVKSSADEGVLRDIWKQARSAAISDKALVVQKDAYWCIEQLVQNTTVLDNSTDFDRMQAISWRVMDNSSPTVRKAAASALAKLMVKNHSASADRDPAPKSKKQKKARAPVADEDGIDQEIERPESPAPQKGAALALSLADILRIMSTQYTRQNVSNRVRAAVVSCYLYVCKGLGESKIEAYFEFISKHLFEELFNASPIFSNRYRVLMTRRYIRLILGDVVCRQMLGESAQLNAIRSIVNSVIKDYPQPDAKDRSEPSKDALVSALDTLTTLIQNLGSAVASVAELCRGGILQVLEHPSYTVQTYAARCLKALVLACPQHLLPSVMICMNSVNREVGLLSGPRRSPRKCIGFALALAATISTSSSQPLYGSVDVYSRILSQATTILKSSGDSDVRIAKIQIQVAWILIGGLMALGPNFVKIHLSQLLLLWKNALPKPLSKDNIGQRGLLELSFLAHVRDCALGSIAAFLTFNGRLLTVDVSKRLAAMLQNTTMFLSSLPSKKTTEDTEKQLTAGLQLYDHELMVRRRVFECYTQLVQLSPPGNQESLLQSSVLSMAAAAFADPENASGSSLSATIASASGIYESIWDLGDNFGFGVTGLVNGFDVDPLTPSHLSKGRHWTTANNVQNAIDKTIRAPIVESLEHDSLRLYTSSQGSFSTPLSTGVVDAAIRFFAVSLQFHSPKVQEGTLEQISSLLANANPQRYPGREAAVMTNVSVALLYVLQVATGETDFAKGNFRPSEVERAIQELLLTFLKHNDSAIRNVAAEALGRLCKLSSHEFTTKEVNSLVELIVSDRDPNVRAGCANALGCIHSELGGMAAGFHLKNILGVLTSLASDPHPTVHFWALDGLSKIADSSGLAFSAHVSSTLGLLAQLYVLESHGEETDSLGSSNIELDLPSLPALARCVHAMINVLGPDLQDMTKERNMILTLTYQFQVEDMALVSIESLKCLESLSLYAPGHISFKPYLRQLQTQTRSSDPDTKDTALTGLHNAMRRGAEEVISTASSDLEDQLWSTMNECYAQGTIRKLMDDWVNQSGLADIGLWIQRIQKVLTKVQIKETSVNTQSHSSGAKEPDLKDEEVAGFAASASRNEKGEPGNNAESGQELLRWQVRYCAMDYLNEIMSEVAREVSIQGESSAIAALQPRVADLVRIAFSASTASVIEMRVSGIRIIGHVLQIFGRVPDPDFPEVTLLEQYQAQISSALTPAFAADSSPALAAEALNVCGAFLSTGIVTNRDRMGRILKLMVSSLEDFSQDADTTGIGDLKGLSSNAQVMVKLAIFSAWAELQIASNEHEYLEAIVKPYLETLTPLWLTSLREYARLKFEPDISGASAAGAVTGGLDTIYAALNRETLLKFYQASWLNFVNAIASLIEKDSEFVFDALDGRQDGDGEAQTNGETGKGHDINYRDEPVAFFFVLFGICFEALVAKPNDQGTTKQRTLDLLQAIHRILKPSVAGLAIYQDAIFSEAMDLFDRLILTENLEVQNIIVEIARDLCINHPSARRTNQTDGDDTNLSDDVEQLFELTRIIVLAIAQYVPNLSENGATVKPQLSEDVVALITLAMTALVDSAEVFPTVIKGDLHACILHVFATILSAGSCQESVVPHCLPIFRRFTSTLARNPQKDTVGQIRNALTRFHVVLRNAQKRESSASLACERNTLLAMTMLLTSTAKILPPEDKLVKRSLDELVDCLHNRMTTSISATLARSLLLLAAASKNPTANEAMMSTYLLPHVITFLTNPSNIEGTEESRISLAQGLTSFAVSLPPAQRPSAIAIVVPTLLKRAAMDGEPVWKETSSRLVELATKEQGAFRSVLASMEKEQRSFAESVIKQGHVGARSQGRTEGGVDEEDENKEPTITLKMDF